MDWPWRWDGSAWSLAVSIVGVALAVWALQRERDTRGRVSAVETEQRDRDLEDALGGLLQVGAGFSDARVGGQRELEQFVVQWDFVCGRVRGLLDDRQNGDRVRESIHRASAMLRISVAETGPVESRTIEAASAVSETIQEAGALRSLNKHRTVPA